MDVTQSPSVIIPQSIRHKVAKADSAAAFVVSHVQDFHCTMATLNYEGEYEILVGLIGSSTEGIIILFSNEVLVSRRSLTRRLKWVTKAHGCTLFTPSASLDLPDGAWIRQRGLNTLETSDMRGGGAGSSYTGKPASSTRATKGREKASVDGTNETLPKSPSSSHHSSVSRRDSGNKGGPESCCEYEYGEPLKKLKVIGGAGFYGPVQASNSTDEVFESKANIDVQLDFDLDITACANPNLKLLTIPGSDGYKLNTALWTKVDIKHLTLLSKPDEEGQGAWYYMEKLKLFVGSTPIVAYPVRFGEWKISSPDEVRVKNEESKGAISAAMTPHGTTEGTRGKTNTTATGRDTLHLYNACESDIKNNTNYGVYVWRQRGVDPNMGTTFHLEGQHAPFTVFNYRKVKDTREVKSLVVATRVSWSIMPDEGVQLRPWLLQRFRDKRKKPLYANLIHIFKFEVELASMPESQSKEEELVVQLEATELEGLQGIKSKDALRHSQTEFHPELSLQVDFGQSIRGTTSKCKTPLQSFWGKVSSFFKRSSGSNAR